MLLDAMPDLAHERRARTPVAGEVPNPLDPPPGCAFHPRCPHANERCRAERPELLPATAGGTVACHAVDEGRLAAAPALAAGLTPAPARPDARDGRPAKRADRL